jgi:hypothetical protein
MSLPIPTEPSDSVFRPCPACGALVLVGCWAMAEGKQPGAWQQYPIPRDPVFGTDHACYAQATSEEAA